MSPGNNDNRLLAEFQFYRRLGWMMGLVAAVTFSSIFLIFRDDERFLTSAVILLFGLFFGNLWVLARTRALRRRLIATGSPHMIGPLAESLYSTLMLPPVDDDGNVCIDPDREETIQTITTLLSKASGEVGGGLSNRQAGFLYRCLDPVWTHEEADMQLALLERISAWRDTRALAAVDKLAERHSASESEALVKAKAIACQRILEKQAEQALAKGSLLRPAIGASSEDLLIPRTPQTDTDESALLRAAVEESTQSRD